MTARRARNKLLLALVVLFINLPLAHSTWTRWRVDSAGTQVTAEVTGNRVLDPDGDRHYWLGLRFPEAIDPQRAQWSAEVDRTTYSEAVATGEIEARVLKGRPSAFRVQGQVRRRTGLVTTLAADTVLLVLVLVVRRSRRRKPSGRPPLRISAVGDLETCPPGSVLELLDETLYLVRGEVVEVRDGEVVLDVGAREVVVVLDGHRNLPGQGAVAQVRGRLIR